MSIQTGHLNGFTPSGRIPVDGSFDTIFAVPGTTSFALRGLAFPGVAQSRCRNRKKSVRPSSSHNSEWAVLSRKRWAAHGIGASSRTGASAGLDIAGEGNGAGEGDRTLV
jgi:hypothetical protein